MDFLPKNKWLALLVFMLIIITAVTVSLAITKVVPDAKNPGNMRFKLAGAKKKA